MPKYTKKRTYRKRPTYRKRARKVSPLVKREVKKQLFKNAEKKMCWLSGEESALTTLTQFYAYDPLDISQGFDTRTRIGDEIRLGGIHARFLLKNNSNYTVYVRMALVKTFDEYNFTSSSYIFDTNVGGQTTPSSLTGIKQIYTPFDTSRINIVWNKILKLAPANGTDGKECAVYQRWANLRNIKIQYQANSSGSQNVKPRYHILFCLADADNDTSTGNTIEVSWLVRTYFTDM